MGFVNSALAWNKMKVVQQSFFTQTVPEIFSPRPKSLKQQGARLYSQGRVSQMHIVVCLNFCRRTNFIEIFFCVGVDLILLHGLYFVSAQTSSCLGLIFSMNYPNIIQGLADIVNTSKTQYTWL